jgi:catalase
LLRLKKGIGRLTTGQEYMIGNLVADLSHVTIPAIQRHAIENLQQADEALAASVAKGLGL